VSSLFNSLFFGHLAGGYRTKKGILHAYRTFVDQLPSLNGVLNTPYSAIRPDAAPFSQSRSRQRRNGFGRQHRPEIGDVSTAFARRMARNLLNNQQYPA